MSACLRGPNLYGQTIFRFRSNFAGRLPLAKGFLPQPWVSAIPACPSKHDREITPYYLASRTNVTTAHRNGIQTERHHSNIYSPYTLQKLKNPYIDTFVNKLGGESPKQLDFTAKIAQFQPHFLHPMQSQILHSKQS